MNVAIKIPDCYGNTVVKPLALRRDAGEEMAQVDGLWRDLRHAEFCLKKAAERNIVEPVARERLVQLAAQVRQLINEAGLGRMGL